MALVSVSRYDFFLTRRDITEYSAIVSSSDHHAQGYEGYHTCRRNFHPTGYTHGHPVLRDSFRRCVLRESGDI